MPTLRQGTHTLGIYFSHSYFAGLRDTSRAQLCAPALCQLPAALPCPSWQGAECSCSDNAQTPTLLSARHSQRMPSCGRPMR